MVVRWPRTSFTRLILTQVSLTTHRHTNFQYKSFLVDSSRLKLLKLQFYRPVGSRPLAGRTVSKTSKIWSFGNKNLLPCIPKYQKFLIAPWFNYGTLAKTVKIINDSVAQHAEKLCSPVRQVYCNNRWHDNLCPKVISAIITIGTQYGWPGYSTNKITSGPVSAKV